MSLRRFVPTSRLAVMALLACGWCRAQTTAPEPPALSKLRAGFEQRVRVATGPLNDFYERALSTLENTAAANGDYEQARTVKLRREQLAASGVAAANIAANAVFLSPESARTTGGVTTRGGELANWKSAASAVQWELLKLVPGNYQLQLTYAMTERPPESGTGSTRAVEPATEAAFIFREVSLLPAAAKNSRVLKFVPTKAASQVLTTEVPLEFSRSSVTLRLAPGSSYPGNLFSIRDIKLMPAPAVPASAMATVPVSFGSEWQQFQKNMGARVSEARRPVVEAYNASLNQQLPPGADDELTAKIQGEQRKALRRIDEVAARAPAGVKLSNFENIEGARFVPDPGNQGDRFKVEHLGRTFFVRLAWVACPPLDPADRKRMKIAVDHFGGDELEMLNLGNAARDFTALYLDKRPLRMLVRQSSKREEEALALVFVDDIGLFQSVLIDHGLAVVEAPPTAARGSIEQGLFKDMQDREEAARKQKNPPGGWGLKSAP